MLLYCGNTRFVEVQKAISLAQLLKQSETQLLQSIRTRGGTRGTRSTRKNPGSGSLFRDFVTGSLIGFFPLVLCLPSSEIYPSERKKKVSLISVGCVTIECAGRCEPGDFFERDPGEDQEKRRAWHFTLLEKKRPGFASQINRLLWKSKDVSLIRRTNGQH